MLQGWRVGVVIPARNEERFIAKVLENLPDWVDCAVVVNDGSTDNTQQRAMEARAPCEVIVLQGNGEGVGAAIDRGHRRLLEDLAHPFVSAVMAGDDQMNPDDLQGVVMPVIQGECDHVKGNRGLHDAGYKGMPRLRRWATAILAFFTTLAAGQPVNDPQCGYTATSSEVLNEWDWKRSWSGYGYPNHWLIRLSEAGWKWTEVAVQSVYRDEDSGIKPGRFFLTVGPMMALEHHRRNVTWLRSPHALPHTWLALIAYGLGWSALLPVVTNDLEIALVGRGVPTFALTLFFWTVAHVFDRTAARTRQELRRNAKA
jgi:glycosyltransferase involved in cell wall biosynthesis